MYMPIVWDPCINIIILCIHLLYSMCQALIHFRPGSVVILFCDFKKLLGFSVVPFHKDFSPSGEQIERLKLAHGL